MSAGFILLLLVLVLSVIILAAAYIIQRLRAEHMVMVEDPCDKQLVNIVLRLPEGQRIKLENDIRKGDYND